MTNYIYVATFSFGSGSIDKMRVVKETKKTFKVKYQETVVGDRCCFLYTVNKSSVDWFDSYAAALAHLVTRSETYLRQCQHKTALARSERNSLQELCDLNS